MGRGVIAAVSQTVERGGQADLVDAPDAGVKFRYLGDKGVRAPGRRCRWRVLAAGGLWVGEGAKFFGAVVADAVDADDLAVFEPFVLLGHPAGRPGRWMTGWLP
jgi:hypothetical protein